ncbi:relaxin-3 [Microcaecilia unicolor]|uniref:Relaxin-3 n=1 Tax=Microcaecilia unicolor TaxID=1415580 RepID=A0A6P7XKF9_9AMPH|nr:relaxin-3 [Microcaecilia unicolor]
MQQKSIYTKFPDGFSSPAVTDSGEENTGNWKSGLPDSGNQLSWREYLAGSSKQTGNVGLAEDVLDTLFHSERRGRDVILGLASTCCKWGCSKSEISSLC